MQRLLLAAVVAGLLLQPAQASGQAYTGVPDATEYLDFLAGSGVNGGYRVQVGPYLARFAGDPSSAQFSVYCVDYTHFAKDQSVNVTGLDPAGNFGNTRLDDYARYQQAAYLSSLFATTDPTTQWGSLHAAIWSITSGVDVGVDDAQRAQYLIMAAINGTSFDTADWYVLSPTPLNPTVGSSGQEFLIRRVSVPEPATFVLLATGLLVLAAFTRKRLTGLREVDA